MRTALFTAFLTLAAPSALAQGPPPPLEHDRVFFLMQSLRAIEAKTSLLLEQGKNEAAIEELKKVAAVEIPKELPLYEAKAHLIGRLAITYTNIGKKKEAVETIQKLLADVQPGSVAEATAYLDAGVVYRQAGMPDEALKAFDRALELSQKLAKTPRGPAGRPGLPPGPLGGPPGGPPRNHPKGDLP